MDRRRPHDLRALVAVVILLGLLLSVVAAFWLQGFDEASRLYGMLQGLLLGAFGWLNGSFGAERARQDAAEALEQRARLAREVREAEDALARLEDEAKRLRRTIESARKIPRNGKVEEGGDELEEQKP